MCVRVRRTPRDDFPAGLTPQPLTLHTYLHTYVCVYHMYMYMSVYVYVYVYVYVHVYDPSVRPQTMRF